MYISEEKLVAKQYTDYVYPEPINDMLEWIKSGKRLSLDLELNQFNFWPYSRNLNNINILVAGCGTNQAAYYAIRNPNCNVIGIDLSLSSLSHQKYLKEKHKINNLSLYQGSILNVDALKVKFDLIYCTGVLHHLPSPDEGLRSLKSVLKSDGVMGLMLYGKSLRTGVYILQEAFRTMQLKQTDEDIQIVKKILAELKPHHACHAYLESALDLRVDSGIVDTFLHPIDRAYSIKEVLNFVRNNGLEFMRWVVPTLYDLNYNFKKNHPAYDVLNKLNVEDQWHAIDLINQSLGKHEFIIGFPEHAINSFLDFKSNLYFKYIPIFPKTTAIVKTAQNINDTSIFRVQGIDFTIKGLELVVLSKIDGINNIETIIKDLKNQYPEKNWELISNGIFSRLNDLGAMSFIKQYN